MHQSFSLLSFSVCICFRCEFFNHILYYAIYTVKNLRLKKLSFRLYTKYAFQTTKHLGIRTSLTARTQKNLAVHGYRREAHKLGTYFIHISTSEKTPALVAMTASERRNACCEAYRRARDCAGENRATAAAAAPTLFVSRVACLHVDSVYAFRPLLRESRAPHTLLLPSLPSVVYICI